MGIGKLTGARGLFLSAHKLKSFYIFKVLRKQEKKMQQRLFGPQSLRRLLRGPSQKGFAAPAVSSYYL